MFRWALRDDSCMGEMRVTRWLVCEPGAQGEDMRRFAG